MSTSIHFDGIEAKIKAVITLLSSKDGYNFLSASHQTLKACNKFLKELAIQEKSISQILNKGKLALEHSMEIKGLIPKDLTPETYDYWLVWVTSLILSEDQPANIFTHTINRIGLGVFYMDRLFPMPEHGENLYRFFYLLHTLEKEYRDFYINLSKGISDIKRFGVINFHEITELSQKFYSPKILTLASKIKTKHIPDLEPSFSIKLKKETNALNEKRKVFLKSLGFIKDIGSKASFDLSIPLKGMVQLSSHSKKRLNKTFGGNSSLLIETFINSKKNSSLYETGEMLKIDKSNVENVINNMRNNIDYLTRTILG
ncbi:MAG: hypothetical protein SV062_10860 [Thermodesulfobacteriota bacterium]|nr:hypothetical protein [Thermodesulfobacteriota bacterium]